MSRWHATEEPFNPVGQKVETSPGNGQFVSVGQTITYRIWWVNDATDAHGTPVAAPVMVADPIDVGLTYVSSTLSGTYTEGQDLRSVFPRASQPSYDYHGVVVWNLGTKKPGETGYVELTCQVNENASQDGIVFDTAYVNGAKTDTVFNPLPGNHKIEMTPGDGQSVIERDQITYMISFYNDQDQPRDITIVDPLDVGVDFVGASDGGSYDANGALPFGLGVPYRWHGTVNWTIPNVPADSGGYVTLTVRVNKEAIRAGIVKDQAFVRVGNGPWRATEIPQNPLRMLVPKTSDDTPLAPLAIVAVVAAAGFGTGAWLLVRSRRGRSTRRRT